MRRVRRRWLIGLITDDYSHNKREEGGGSSSPVKGPPNLTRWPLYSPVALCLDHHATILSTYNLYTQTYKLILTIYKLILTTYNLHEPGHHHRQRHHHRGQISGVCCSAFGAQWCLVLTRRRLVGRGLIRKRGDGSRSNSIFGHISMGTGSKKENLPKLKKNSYWRFLNDRNRYQSVLSNRIAKKT